MTLPEVIALVLEWVAYAPGVGLVGAVLTLAGLLAWRGLSAAFWWLMARMVTGDPLPAPDPQWTVPDDLTDEQRARLLDELEAVRMDDEDADVAASGKPWPSYVLRTDRPLSVAEVDAFRARWAAEHLTTAKPPPPGVARYDQ